MLVGKVGAYPNEEHYTWVSSWPYPRTLDKAGKACQRGIFATLLENSFFITF